MLALLTPEQQMFEDQVGRFVGDRAIASTVDIKSFDRDAGYRSLAELGILGLRMRADGAPLAGGVEAAQAARLVGGGLLPLPYLASGLLVSELLGLAGVEGGLADELSTGALRAGILLSADLSCLADPAVPGAIAWDCEGASTAFGMRPDGQVVQVTLNGAVAEDFADITRQISIPAKGAAIAAVGKPLSAEDQERWLAFALTVVAADLVGALNTALLSVRDYTKEREQYGVKIGSFQAIQHICAEMFVDIEAGLDLVSYASWGIDALPPSEALMAARVAKAYISGIARSTTEAVMQVYGGIGQTWEHIAHVQSRRAQCNALILGSADHHRDLIADHLLKGE